jgi:hypothetical protein
VTATVPTGSMRGGPVGRLAVSVRGDTLRTLFTLVAGLLVLTAAALGTTLHAFVRVHGTAEAVRTRTAPATTQLALARVALVRADQAAIDSFGSRPAGTPLSGSGEEYESQITIASQSLAQVAENNVAGDEGSRRLRLVEGLLATYAGLISQANAHFRQDADLDLGVVDVWSASRLLHGGIFQELGELSDTQQRVLAAELSGTEPTPPAVLAVLLPLAGLLALLVFTQVFLRLRFRRRVNPWLLAATALVLALVAGVVVVAAAQRHLDAARGALGQLTADRASQADAIDAQGQRSLSALLLRHRCGGSCSPTIDQFVADVAESGKPANGPDDTSSVPTTRRVADLTAAADANALLEPAIYLAALLIGVTVLLGFRPRLNEYRYRSR